MADRTRTENLRLTIDGQQVANSYNDLVQTQRLLKKELKGVEVGTDEYVKKSQQLNKVNQRLDSVKKDINGVGNEWKKQGDAFKSGLVDRIDGIRVFNYSIGDMRKGFGSVTGSVQGTSKALQFFKAALIGSGIGAIVVLLGSLVAWLTTTQEGMDKVTAVTRPLSAIFQRLIGVVQELGGKVFKELAEFIDDPIGKFKELGQVILDNVLNRFKAISLVGPAIGKIISGDIAGGFRDLADAGIQATTGITDGLDKIQNAAEGVVGFVDDAIERGTRLDQLQKAIEKGNIDLIRNEGRLNRLFQEGRELANDRTKAEEERQKGVDQARAALEELESKRLAQLDLQITKLKEQHELNDTSRADLEELARLEAEREEAIAVTAKKNVSLLALEESIRNENAKNEKERIKQAKDEAIGALDEEIAQKRLKLSEDRANELISDAEFKEEQRILELAHLTMLKEIKQKFGEDTLAIDQKIVDEQIALIEEKEEAEAKAAAEKKKIEDDLIKSIQARKEADIESVMASVEGAKTISEATKSVLNNIRDAIKARIQQAVADQIQKVIATVPFPFNLAVAGTAAAAVNLLFNKFVPGFFFGGDTGSGPAGLGRDQYGNIRGVVHENEFVIPAKYRNDPYVANVENAIMQRQRGLPVAGDGASLSGSAGGSQSFTLSGTDKMESAAALMLQAANVLKNTRIQAEFSRRSFRTAREDDDEQEAIRSDSQL